LNFKLLLIAVLLPSWLFSSTLNIAVAANVSYAIKDIKSAFLKQNPSIKLNIILGGSGSLTAKILHNAPYDIFMSANMMYPISLYKSKYAITKPKVYAQGGLAILSKKNIDLTKKLNILLDTNIKKIAIANPKTAPYGVATIEALKKIKIFNNIKHKIIYGESISQTLLYTLKACDIGIVAKSLLYSPQLSYLKQNKNWKSIDNKLFTPIDQGIVILKRAKNNIDAIKFYDFIFSKKAKNIFKKYGYEVWNKSNYIK
jgi:molybdate transport system substrate-binding protein